MTRARFWDTVTLAAIAAAGLATALVYQRLPERVATHFDIHGTADGWMPRIVGAWFMPVFMLGLWALLAGVRVLLPKDDRERVGRGLYAFVIAAVVVVLAVVHGLILYVAIVPETIPMTKVVMFLVALLFVALGLVMPRVRRNPILGVRTAWTLTSDENWARTHRFAGYAMVIGGLVAAIAALVGGASGAVLALLAMIASGIVPVGYSLLLARRSTGS